MYAVDKSDKIFALQMPIKVSRSYFIYYIQWRRQGEKSRVDKRAPKAREHLGGSGGMLPRKNFEILSRWNAISCILG